MGQPQPGPGPCRQRQEEQKARGCHLGWSLREGKVGRASEKRETQLSPQTPQQLAVTPCLGSQQMGSVCSSQLGALEVPQWGGPESHPAPDRGLACPSQILSPWP